jgi:transcriptional regulator with XRE-family HTH domain
MRTAVARTERLPIFAERLKLAMHRANISQVELAKTIDAHGSDISKMWRQLFLPGALRLRLMAENLHVSTDWLLGLVPDDGQPGDYYKAQTKRPPDKAA